VSVRSGAWKVIGRVLAATGVFLVIGVAAPPASAADPVPAQVRDAFPRGLPDGAVVVDADTVASANGTLVIDLSASSSTDGVCPDGWVCLWTDADWTGSRIRFSACDVTGDGVCDWQNLTLWSWNDVMSSWMNHKAVDARWAYDVDGGGTLRCMQAGAENSWVGSSDNDEASSIKIFKTATTC
jgi:Peptidase inhibitor family I36